MGARVLTNTSKHSFVLNQHLVLLGHSSLEAAEIGHGSLLGTGSELLGPGSLVPLVLDLTSLESLSNLGGSSTTGDGNDEVGQVQTSTLLYQNTTHNTYGDLLSLDGSGRSVDEHL